MIRSADLEALRRYVTANDSEQYALLPEGVVSINVTHSNLRKQMIELRLDMHMTIAQVKERLHLHHGTPPQHQRLILKDFSGQTICSLDDDSKMFGYYSPESGMEIHIIDTDPFSLSRNGGLEDVSLVDRYVMTEEEYEKRTQEGKTLRSWIREQKQKDPNWKPPRSYFGVNMGNNLAEEIPPAGPEAVQHMQIGNRCQVQPGARRGTIAFIGEVEGLDTGYWVGVQFDEPVGKGNGSYKGVAYFNTEQSYGGFLRPHNVTVGDFPVRDILASDDEECDHEHDSKVGDDEDEI